jgi:hypothetical protein
MNNLKIFFIVLLISRLSLISGFSQTSPELISEKNILTTGSNKIIAFFERPDGNYAAISENSFMIVSLSESHLLKEIKLDAYFEKASGKYSEFSCKEVLKTSDDGFFIAGKGYRNSEPKIFAIKTDSEGKFIWIAEPAEFIYEYDFISEDEAGNFYLSGNDNEESINFIKLNSKGATVWAKAVQSMGKKTFLHTAARPDNTFILTGFKAVGDNNHLIAAGMNTDGNIVWEKDFGIKLQETDYSYYEGGCWYNHTLESAAFSDNSFYTKAKAGDKDVFVFADQKAEVLFTLTGDEFYSGLGVASETEKGMQSSQIIKLNNKYLATISVCQTDREKSPFNASFIMDKKGKMTWNKVFENSEWYYDMIKLKDGGVLLNVSVNSDTEMLKFDKKGNLQWQMNYGDKSWQSDTPMIYKQQADGKSILLFENDFDAVNYVYKLVIIQE